MTLRTVCRNATAEEQGQALVEMAVGLPVLLLLLCGLFSLCTVLFGWCNITCASRQAVRYASLHSSTSLVPATTDSISTGVTPFLIGAVATSATTSIIYTPANTIGSTVKIKVSATYPVVMPFTSYSSFTLASTSQRTITR